MTPSIQFIMAKSKGGRKKRITKYNNAWLHAEVEKLMDNGVIRKYREVADATGFPASNFTAFKTIGHKVLPSESFVAAFKKVYGDVLKQIDNGTFKPVLPPVIEIEQDNDVEVKEGKKPTKVGSVEAEYLRRENELLKQTIADLREMISLMKK